MVTCAGKSIGRLCYYCRRVWRTNFSAAFPLEKFVLQCASDQPTFDALSLLVSFAIGKIVAAGSHNVVIRKSDFDATAEDCVPPQVKRAGLQGRAGRDLDLGRLRAQLRRI